MPTFQNIQEIAGFIAASMRNNKIARITLSRPVKKQQELQNIYIRPVELKQGRAYSFTFRYLTRDEVHNHSIEEAAGIILEYYGKSFLNMHVYSLEQDLEVRSGKDGSLKVRSSDPSFDELPDMSHDRSKKRYVQTKGNMYLQELEITDASGKIRPGKNDKFRQIQKYVEILDSLIDKLKPVKSRRLHITDMGSGKGYLTFALYEHLVQNEGLKVMMTGVEQRTDLVKESNRISKLCRFAGLKFKKGSILDFSPEHLDVLIALHACDTATDDAIFQGIKNNASLIVCAPCCHKQVRNEMDAKAAEIPLVQHGILMERQAELLTDSLRALLMQLYGYESQVFEFISTDHTPKNIMITGMKTEKSIDKRGVKDQITILKKQFGIRSHHLETLLSEYDRNFS